MAVNVNIHNAAGRSRNRSHRAGKQFLLAFTWPSETALFLLYLVAIWTLVTGFAGVSAAFVFSGSTGQRWGLGSQVCSIICGIILDEERRHEKQSVILK